MKKLACLLALGALSAIFAASAGAQAMTDRDRDMSQPSVTTDRGMDQSGTSQYSTTAPSTAGEQGSVQSSATVNAPKRHFLAARSAFTSRDYQAAANHLRQGAEILRSDAANARGDVADNLRGTAKDLDKLADKVQQGKVTSVDDLNDKFGDAYRNLADYHYQVAEESYKRNRETGVKAGRDVETGTALQRATQDVEDWSEVTGRTIKSGGRTALDATKDLAGRMISGTGWAAEKTGEGLNNFGEFIRSWGRDIRVTTPEERAPAAPDTNR